MRVWDGKYLSLTADGQIEKVNDIGGVVSEGEEEAMEEIGQAMVEEEITAVLGVDEYASCNGKIKQVNKVIGDCVNKMSVNARLVIEKSGGRTCRVTAFNDQVKAIVDDVEGSSLEDILLMKFAVKNNICLPISHRSSLKWNISLHELSH